MSFHGNWHFPGGAVTGTGASHQRCPTVVMTQISSMETKLLWSPLVSSPLTIFHRVKRPGAAELSRKPSRLGSAWLGRHFCPLEKISGSSVPQEGRGAPRSLPSPRGIWLHKNSPWFQVCLTRWFGHQSISVMFLVLGIRPQGRFPGGVCWYYFQEMGKILVYVIYLDVPVVQLSFTKNNSILFLHWSCLPWEEFPDERKEEKKRKNLWFMKINN